MWLLDNSVRQALEQAYAAGAMLTAEQQSIYYAQHNSNMEQNELKILSTVGTTARIAIDGILTKAPDFCALFFGGGNTTYSDIISALDIGDRDDNISNAILMISSPGGSVSGLFDTLTAIDNFSKPITAFVSDMAASAAFMIAASTNRIEAANVGTQLGSVGVIANYMVSDEFISISNTKSPKKSPDVKTAEGVAMVKDELDALHDVIVSGLAKGRGVSETKVNEEFGQGAIVLADEALKRGMIDSIATVTSQAIATTQNQLEETMMDIKELKSQHANEYNAAVQEGVAQERDRVTAHLTMGESSGDLKTAYTAIKEGAKMTETLRAVYMSANMAKHNIAQRDKEDLSATAGDNVTQIEGDDTVISLIENKLGLKRG